MGSIWCSCHLGDNGQGQQVSFRSWVREAQSIANPEIAGPSPRMEDENDGEMMTCYRLR